MRVLDVYCCVRLPFEGWLCEPVLPDIYGFWVRKKQSDWCDGWSGWTDDGCHLLKNCVMDFLHKFIKQDDVISEVKRPEITKVGNYS